MDDTVLGAHRIAEALREHTGGMARAVTGADPDTTVPTCPEWTLRDLVGHIGQAHRWAAGFIRSGETDLVTELPRTAPDAPGRRTPDRTDPDGPQRRFGDGQLRPARRSARRRTGSVARSAAHGIGNERGSARRCPPDTARACRLGMPRQLGGSARSPWPAAIGRPGPLPARPRLGTRCPATAQ